MFHTLSIGTIVPNITERERAVVPKRSVKEQLF